MSDTNPLPTYIPPHLRGKVENFRNEDDGTISFEHPDSPSALGTHDSRVRLSPEQYKQTFDPNYRRMNFNESMNGQYALRRPETSSQRLNRGIGQTLRSIFDWGTSSQGKAIGTAGTLAALAGGGAGYLLNRGNKGALSKSLLFALLAGGLGAGGAALLQNRHNAREAFLSKKASPAVSQALIMALHNDVTLSGWDRSNILRALADIEERERDELYRLVRTTIGAGAGILAMHFLKRKGLLPMLAGGILGGVVGHSFSQGQKLNGLGQLSTIR